MKMKGNNECNMSRYWIALASMTIINDGDNWEFLPIRLVSRTTLCWLVGNGLLLTFIRKQLQNTEVTVVSIFDAISPLILAN